MKHLILNYFITVENIILKQDVRVPVGIYPDIFLYFHENKFITELVSNNKIKARNFIVQSG